MKRFHRKSSAGPDEQDVLAVIGAIYDSALDLSNGRVAMQRITQALGGHRALMFVPDLSARGFWAAHDIEPSMMAGSEEHYRRVDVWTNRCHDAALSKSPLASATSISCGDCRWSRMFAIVCSRIGSGNRTSTRESADAACAVRAGR